MKKLFILAIAVLGTSFASQAQDTPPGDQGTIEFTIFESGNTTYGVAVGDNINNRCVEVKNAADGNNAITAITTELVYSIDASGQRYRGTTSLGSPNPNLVRAFTAGSFYRLYTRDGRTFGNAVNLTDGN